MKKLVILLILLCAAGAAAWFIYREAPSGPEDKAVLYGNVDLRQVDLAFLISERIDSVLVDEGDTVVPGRNSPRWKRCACSRPWMKRGRQRRPRGRTTSALKTARARRR